MIGRETEIDVAEMMEMATMEMSHWQKVADLVQETFQEGHMAEDATSKAVVLIPNGGRGIPRHSPSGGGVGGSDSDSQLLLHHIHRLPQHPPYFLGGSRHRYCFTRDQHDSVVNGHKEIGPAHYIYGHAQYI